MRDKGRLTAITTAVILSLSFLTATTQSAKAASNQVSILSGQARAGDFLNPRGISVAPSGEVFVADSNNFAIKKISTDGVVSVFAKTNVREDGWTDESFCSVYAKNSDEIWAGNCNNTKLYRYLRGNLVREIALVLPFTR
jgi:streptogramin lyase